MTICKEFYRSNSDYFADISIKKYSNLYTMTITKPIEKGSDLVNVIYKNDYWTIQNARKALYRQGKNMNVKFARVKGEE